MQQDGDREGLTVQLFDGLHDDKSPERSVLQLCSSPVTPPGVVPDCVVSAVSDPVGQRPVLLDLFSQSHFLCEGLDTSHFLLLINNLHS